MHQDKRITGAEIVVTNPGGRGEAGFTLVEMLVAITVLALSLLAIGPLLSTSLNLDRDTALKVKARALAAYKMDEIIGQGLVTSVGCIGAPLTDDQKICVADYACSEYIDSDSNTISQIIPAGAAYVVTRDLSMGPTVNAFQLCHIEVTATYTIKGETKDFVLRHDKLR